jgi:hypothetical protein
MTTALFCPPGTLDIPPADVRALTVDTKKNFLWSFFSRNRSL